MELLEIINSLDKDLFIKMSVFVTSCRMIMKPVCSFWNSKINPYVEFKPKEKLLKHPLYKGITFLLDWSMSIKMPQDKE